MKHILIKSRLLAAFVLACSLATGGVHPAAATGADQDQAHLEALDGEITSLKERVPELKAQIAKMEAMQRDTAKDVADATRQEVDLRPQLDTAAAAYRKAMDTFKEAVRVDYEAKERGAMELAIENGSISESLSQVSYRAAVSEQLEGYADAAETAASAMRERKNQLDATLDSLELLQRQQRALAAGLAGQKQELADAIAHKQDEASYLREQLARANAVRNGILAGIMGGAFEEGAHVRRGAVIGFEGSTGFSTGCHTHFSVIDGGRWVDPARYWHRLRKPDGMITQGFGMTEWARSGVYGGNIHNGVDFIQGCGNPVHAAGNGTVIRDTRNDGSGFGHYVMIRHRGGIVTLYGHLI